MQRHRLFVEVNDSIRRLARQAPATQTWDFICECPEVSCSASVRLTLGEFDRRRAASPPRPVRAEHDT